MADQEKDDVRQPFHREGEAFVLDSPPDLKEAARQAREDEQHEFARSQVKTNRRIARFNGFLVGATFATIAVGIWQGSISQKAANAAKDAVKVAQDTLAETQASNADQRLQSAQSRSDALAASILSRNDGIRTLQVTIDNFRQDQRAWMRIVQIQAYPSTDAGDKSGRVEISYVNSGKTPAFNVRQYRNVTPFLKNIPAYDLETDPNAMFVAAVTPGNPHYTIVPIPDAQWQELQVGLANQFIYGTIWYDDAFTKKRHWTQFCYQLKSHSPNIAFDATCGKHDEVDH